MKGLKKKVKKLLKNNRKYSGIVSPSPGGHPWGLLIAKEFNLPLIIIREKETFQKGELSISYRSALYGTRTLYFPNIPFPKKKKRVLLIDDIISTASTSRTIINFLRAQGYTVRDVVCILTKGPGFLSLEAEDFVKVHSLVHLTTEGSITTRKEIEKQTPKPQK